MTTIILDDALVNEVLAASNTQNAQEADTSVIADYYLQQHKNQLNFFDQLRLKEDIADDGLTLLFERDKDVGRNIEL